MMCENYTVLTLKRHSGNSLQVLAVCLLPTLFIIAIPAKYKITESMTYNQLLCTYQRDYIVTCHVSNRSCGLYRVLPQLSLIMETIPLGEIQCWPHLVTCKFIFGQKKQDFPREVLHCTACVHVCRSEIINEWY